MVDAASSSKDETRCLFYFFGGGGGGGFILVFVHLVSHEDWLKCDLCWPGGGFPSVAPPQGPSTAKGYKRGWAWGGGATGLHVRHTHTQGYSPAVYRDIQYMYVSGHNYMGKLPRGC